MPELLLQSALAASRSNQLAAEAAQIKSACHAQHGDSKPLVSHPQYYEALLEALRARYLNPASTTTTPSAGWGGPQQQEWFTSRPAFLSALNLLIDSAKEYQVSPQAVDDRVREERSRWYAERVRASLLRLMVEDPSGRGAVFEKLEDLSSTTAGGDPVALAREVAEILSKGLLAPEQGAEGGSLPDKLAAAGDEAGKAEVLREAFFRTEDGAVPEDHQKYLDMLLHQGLPMEQVVDRILEERQTATGAREQTDKLKQRLDELRRARAAHEAQKTRKAQRRESLAQQKVPDDLYELPACAVCGAAPPTEDYFACSICTILAGAGAREKQTVFCSEKCEQQGHAPHAAETHTCSSGLSCIQRRHHHQRSTTTTTTTTKQSTEDTAMADAPSLPIPSPSSPPSPSPFPATDIHFCTECLTSLKQPTTWCSLACADANFAAHREGVHLPAAREEKKKKRLGSGLVGEDVKREDSNNGGGREDGVKKDIRTLTTSLGEAVREWEGRNRVRLLGAV
ncbi:hypothetical protein C8A01DRAFT_12690 [Parachaetomium inaequale]|uniref:Uncharacterized protein n=1 Tax=Parachaetomium inaequale TaxID=2588326 RepID=A0AAN6PN03_9PEZI|nr:hypothetical protein C8A01DRAFT_12690 [Parachaetomium inaequale]